MMTSLVVASLVSGGCGGDDDTDTDTIATSPSTSASSSGTTDAERDTDPNESETTAASTTSGGTGSTTGSSSATNDTSITDECQPACDPSEECRPSHYCDGVFACVTSGEPCGPGAGCTDPDEAVCLDSAMDDVSGVCISFAEIDALCAQDPSCWQQCPMGGTGTGTD